MKNDFVVEFFGNKEVFVSYTNNKGNTMKLYGTFKNDTSDEYKAFVVNRLKGQIEASKFFNE